MLSLIQQNPALSIFVFSTSLAFCTWAIRTMWLTSANIALANKTLNDLRSDMADSKQELEKVRDKQMDHELRLALAEQHLPTQPVKMVRPHTA